MSSLDDFPVSPERTVDSQAFYRAYLKANQLIAEIPAKYRGADVGRTLQNLVYEIYGSEIRGEALFRASAEIPQASATLWLSQVRSIAQWAVAAGSIEVYRGLDQEFVIELAKTSVSLESMRQVEFRLAQRGVALVHQLATPGTKIDGCAFTLSTGHPVIGITLRYARLDYYYFTLMHELAHLALHYDRLNTPIIDDLDETETQDESEIEANRWAADSLIPRNEWRTCRARYSMEEDDISAFATKLGIAPQIVAGRLRKELRRHDLFSGLIHRVNVREVLSDA